MDSLRSLIAPLTPHHNDPAPSLRRRRGRSAPITAAALVACGWIAAAPTQAAAALGDCGQPVSNGDKPVATDALSILVSAVTPPNLCPPGSGAFDACVCDVDGNGATLASDALVTLQVAVGVPGRQLMCDCPTTTSTTTSTSTSSTLATSTTTLAATAVGVLIDAPVAGVAYRTETLSGITNADGEYEYVPGETVVFSIGDIDLPAVAATGVVTPLVLADSGDIDNNIVVNIARLLQTLDSDGNPDNGITIDADSLTTSALDFDTEPAQFEAEVLAEMGLTLVDQAGAIAHLQGELDALAAGNGELPAALAGNVFDMEFTTANQGAPYTFGDVVTFSFSVSGRLAVDVDPMAADGSEIFMPSFVEVGAEYRWEDAVGGFAYMVSLAGDAIHEINVFALAGDAFVGQFTPYSEEPIPNVGLVTALAGTYPVTAVTSGSHTRDSVTIGADGRGDFDTGIAFTRSQIMVIYDRLFITSEPRIQISYGADDDGEVINLYMVPGNTSVLQSVQFRHRNASIDVEVEVGAAD
jgi:hypothetical protein